MSLAELTQRLVAINSINPSLVPGAPGEAEVIAFAREWLQQAGVRGTVVVETPAGRPSLLCHLPGRRPARSATWQVTNPADDRPGRSLLLYAHADTVGVDGMDAPFSGRIDGDRLHGRGAYDMKGSLAVIMTVAAAYARNPGPGDLWLAIVADEEHGSTGSEAVLREIARRGARIDGAVITEPSDLHLMPGHRGFATGTLITRGRAAHTARRDQGVDAIAMMARVISACEDLDVALNSGAPHPLLGHGALVVSLLQGGSELFTYPAECRAQFVRRMLPGETQAQLDQELHARFAALTARDPRFNVELSWQLRREPLLTALDAPLTRALSACAQSELGHAPDITGAPWWTDGALFQEAGIPAVIFGPRGGGIHAIDEWVDLPSLETLARVLDTLCRMP